MRMTNSEIIETYNNLNEIKGNTQDLPVKVSYAVVRNLNILKHVALDIEKVREDLLRQLGAQRDIDTGNFMIPKDKVLEADEKLKNLGEVDNQIDIYTIPLSLLDGCNIDIKTMNALYFMIIDSEG